MADVDRLGVPLRDAGELAALDDIGKSLERGDLEEDLDVVDRVAVGRGADAEAVP